MILSDLLIDEAKKEAKRLFSMKNKPDKSKFYGALFEKVVVPRPGKSYFRARNLFGGLRDTLLVQQAIVKDELIRLSSEAENGKYL